MYACSAVSDKRVRQELFGLFESGNGYVARHRRKSFQELLERFAAFDGVEKRLDGYSRSPKHRRPAENIRVFHDDVVRGTHSCLQ